MNKEQIWEVLQCCLLVTGEADLNYLVKQGFNAKLAKIGMQLHRYLKSK